MSPFSKKLLEKASQILENYKEPKEADAQTLHSFFPSSFSLAETIDHTLLKTDATKTDIHKLAKEAIDFGFKAVCVQPIALPWVVEFFQKNSAVQPLKAVVIGFPQGANLSQSKADEAKRVLAFGVDEIDVVAPISLLKSALWEEVEEELVKIRTAAGKTVLKLIFETAILTDLEIASLSILALENHYDFLKTSTGFSAQGANLHSVSLLVHCAQKKALVKASGGIKNQDQALQMLYIGANRLGTSSGVALAEKKRN